MYLGRRPRRGSPRLIIVLLLLILAATLLVHYMATRRPTWSTPFEPTPTPTRPAQSYVAEGEAYYAEGQLDEAILSFQHAAEMVPEDASVHTRLTHLLILRDRTAEAYGEARIAVRLAPSDPQALAALCRALDWEGAYTEALDACQCAIEMDPKYAEGYAFLSEVYTDVGNWTAARDYAEQAVDLNYQSMDAHRNQGYAHEIQGRFSKAVESYENAIYLQPKLAPLYISAARSYRAMGKFTEAIDRLERVIRFDPKNPVAYDQLGWTYYNQGNYNRAAEYLEQATVVDPLYTQAWGHLGIVSYVTQQYEDAIQYFQRAIQQALVDYMARARIAVIQGEDETYDPPRAVELMRGEFLPLSRAGVATLVAELSPVRARALTVPSVEDTCGDRIAGQLRQQQPGLVATPASGTNGDAVLDATTTPPVTSLFEKAQGRAVMDLKNRQVEFRMDGLPPTSGKAYEVQLIIWPGKTVSLGSFEPDSGGNAAFTYSFADTNPAPVEYYYSLGFSYVYLDQCSKGLPWLNISLDIDSSATNPAWQGLDQCAAAESTPEPGEAPSAE